MYGGGAPVHPDRAFSEAAKASAFSYVEAPCGNACLTRV